MIAPTVALTSPAEGAVVGGNVTVTADASDDNSVASVQFRVGSVNLGAPDTAPPYATVWNTTLLVNGSQAISAVATDSFGNVATSPTINITTANPARVTITKPTNGENLATTTVTATYVKSGDWIVGDGKHVHLRLDGGPTKMDFDADSNQSYTFVGVPGGSHTLEMIVANGSHVELQGSGGTVSFSTTAPDVTAPTVAISLPADGATLANTVILSADASDDAGVVGVQFLLDGNNLGPEDLTVPYGTTWDTTTSTNGSHVLTARARDSVNQTTSAAVAVNVSNTDPRAIVGEWSPVMNWPIVAVHATLMYTGEILMWDAWERPTSFAKVWNPTTNVFTDVSITDGLFCAGHATGPDGRVVVMGGHDGGEVGIKAVNVFDPITKTWIKKPDMQYARWYPSLTELPDGRMVTFSGQISPGTFADTPEIYNPATGLTTTLPFSTPQLREIQYPQTSVIPNGKVLTISAEQGSVNLYDPVASTWNTVGTTQVPYGVWTSFAPGKYLITGGGAAFNSYSPSNPGPSQRTVRILDMTSGSPVWSATGDMSAGRSFHNVTMLPNGKALAIGGATVVNDFATTGTLTAEQWDPASGSWTQVASPARPRMYHSVSILLPDGRILSAGGGRLAPAPDQLNAQYYSPSYLFQGPRPTITSVPATITHNSTMNIVTPEAADIAKITFVSLASVTHTADWNQHFMELPFTRDGTTLTVNTPANANLAPENYYMVFAVNSAGVPSQAKIVKLGIPDTAAPVISAASASGLTPSTATINWTTSELADSRVEYGTDTSYGAFTTLNASLVTAHAQTISGLTSNTQYHYRVLSRDASGNLATSGDLTFTTAALDTQPPAVTLTSPASGATVSGSVVVSANASDNVAIAGVQFKLDGANLSTEDTISPYSTSWSSSAVTNGAHTLTAVARDPAGNLTTSASITVTVSNVASPVGLVASYNFNEVSGTNLTDLSGNGNHGSVFQAIWYGAGKYGGTLSFDGVDDYVSVPDAPTLDLTRGMTIEAWVRPTATSGWRTVALKEGSGDMSYGIYARESASRPAAWIRRAGSSTSTSAGATPALPTLTWTHIATTYDGASLRLYINGTLRSTKAASGSILTSSNPLKLGGNAIWGEFFAGQIDEVRVYNRLLTASEIKTDMALPL